MSTSLTTLFRTTSKRSGRATTAIAAGGVAALCLGAAAPAYACRTTDGGVQPLGTSAATALSDTVASGMPATDDTRQKPSVDELRAKVLAHIDALTARLADVTQRVTDSDRLTTEQQAAWLERIDAASSALADLREQVAADSTSTEIWRDLRAFWKGHRELMAVAGHRWHRIHEVRVDRATTHRTTSVKRDDRTTDVRRASFGESRSDRGDGARATWWGKHRTGERHGDHRSGQSHDGWHSMTRHR